MNTDNLGYRWGLAYVRKSPLPPNKTWMEVPFYTYLIEQGPDCFYKAMREDRPVDIEAITSYPVLQSFVGTNTYISPDETVYIDWEGNYFIAKEGRTDLTGRRIIGNMEGQPPPYL